MKCRKESCSWCYNGTIKGCSIGVVLDVDKPKENPKYLIPR